jgi:serine/threonine protein kinase
MSTETTSLEGLVCNGKTQEAIEQLKTLIQDLSKEPLSNLMALAGRYSYNTQSENKGIASREMTEMESNRIRTAFLSILTEIREEIQTKINFFKPIPREQDNRNLLRDFIETVLSKKYKEIKPYSEGNTFIYFSAKEKHADLDVMIMILKTSDISGIMENSQLNRIAQLKHRNLIQLLDVNFQVYPYYLITEYVSGINLKTLMDKTGAFPLHNAKRLLLIIGDVMNTLRQKKFSHAGIRPSKILIDHELEPEISPFDILMVNDKKRLMKSFIEDSYYFAPERLYELNVRNTGDAIDKANQFCLAAFGYEMITGEKLFNGKDISELLLSRQIFFKDPEVRKAKLAHKRLPARMAAVFKKMLNENPQKRYDDLPTALREIGKVRAVLDDDEERVFSSYRRCLTHCDNFIDLFYANLFSKPGMEEFKPTLKEEETDLHKKFFIDIHLIFDVENAISFLEKLTTFEEGEKNPAHEYILFMDTFIETVKECDPRWQANSAVEKSWNHIRTRIYEPLKPFLLLESPVNEFATPSVETGKNQLTIDEDDFKKEVELHQKDLDTILNESMNGESFADNTTKVETQFDDEKA